MTNGTAAPVFGFHPIIRLRALARSRLAALLAIVAISLVGAIVPISAYAVHNTGMFELDGNIVHNSATTPPYDWASLFNASGNQLVTPDPVNGPLLASVFVPDFTNPDNSYFDQNGAGVKDIQPIANWGCKTQSNPLSKDNLLNAYAALVQVPSTAPQNAGHKVLYMASERESNNGDSFAGFWLFKDHNVSCDLATSSFNGVHTDGDILVVSNYTNGGGTQDVSVYTWSGGPNGAPVLRFSSGLCGDPLNANDFEGCAIANTQSISSPWFPTTHDSNTFVETGVDLTALFGTAGDCFTTFQAETRSSQELTATLKDFAGGQFNTCVAPTVTTTATPGGSVAPGTAQHDVATVAGGAGQPTPTGSVQFALCGPTQVTSAGCPSGSGTNVGSAQTLSGGSATSPTVNGTSTPSDLAIGKYCWNATYTPDSASAGTYLPSFGTNATTECFTVVGNTTTATTSSVTGAQLPGVSVFDTATVSLNAPATGATPSGSVTFKLCNPSNTCTQVGSAVTLNNGSATSATVNGTTTPNTLAIGKYCWEATYTPAQGSFYNGSSELSHPDGECFTTGTQPTNTTTGVASQTVDVRSSSATVSDNSTTTVFVPAGVTLTPGTVTFKLYGPSATANCSANNVYTSAAIPGSVSGSNVTASVGPVSLATAGITTSGTYWWTATYSGDAYNGGSTSACGTEAVQAVDAFITVTPQTAVNEVGSQHVFTITYTAIPAGTTPSNFTITPSLSPTTGLTTNTNTCAAPNVSGNVATCTYTINASAAGTYTLNASGSASMGGITVTRSTTGDHGPGGTGPAVKHYVDALIAITPQVKVNEVGSEHVFTITYTALPDDAGTPTNFAITPSLSPTTGLTENTNTCATPSVTGNVATCTYTINTTTAGTYTLNATGSSNIGGVVVTRSTSGNAGPNGTGPATKHYVDASIAVSPQTATNIVGNAHTFTITLTAIPDDAGAPSNFTITPSLSPTTGLTTNTNTCATPSVSGNVATCTYTINTNTPGTYTLNATGSVTMGGVTVTRSTSGNSGPGGTGPAVKHYVSASLTITPNNAVNEVGTAHVFTITLTASPDDAGTPSNFIITPSLSPTTGLTQNDSTCASPVVVTNVAMCTVTINTDTAGTYTLNATGQVTIGTQTIQLTTVGGTGINGPATKHYVDASIAISPPVATNIVGNAHVFTITFTAIPDDAGAPSNFSITPSLSPTTNLTQNTNTCASPVVNGNVATCTYTINSDTVGSYTLNAEGSATMGGVTVTRSTSGNSGPGGTGPAVKHYVSATLTITPNNATNEVGAPHTFTITVTALPDDAGPPSDFVITPSLSPTTGLTVNTNTCDTPLVDGNVATCTYTINSDVAGTYTLNADAQVTIGGQTIHLTTVEETGINGPATKHYVDAAIAITPNVATNVIGNAHVFTITLTAIPDDAGAPSDFSITPTLAPTTGLTQNTNTCAQPAVSGNVATCTYTINSNTPGVYTLNATGSVTMGGVTVTRSTSGNSGPGGSGPATKIYVSPNSSLVKAERDVTTPDTTQNGGGFTAGPITANPGDVLEYRLTYANNGKGAASNVVVTDPVPTNHASYLAGSCTGGNSCTFNSSTNTLTWNLGTMPAGSSAVLTFRITLGTDFPSGVVTQISNAAVVTTTEEGSKPSNTVVANVTGPAQAVQAAALPAAGAPLSQPTVWLAVAIVALLVSVVVGDVLVLVRRVGAGEE